MNGSGQGLSEDWLSVIIGLVIFVLALGLLGDMDLLGWVVTTEVWVDLSKALAPVSKAYAGLGGVGALIATYIGLLVLMTAGAAGLRAVRLCPQSKPFRASEHLKKGEKAQNRKHDRSCNFSAEQNDHHNQSSPASVRSRGGDHTLTDVQGRTAS